MDAARREHVMQRFTWRETLDWYDLTLFRGGTIRLDGDQWEEVPPTVRHAALRQLCWHRMRVIEPQLRRFCQVVPRTVSRDVVVAAMRQQFPS